MHATHGARDRGRGRDGGDRRAGGAGVGLGAVYSGGRPAGPPNCLITTPITQCPYTLTLPAAENLLITSTGSIKCDGPGVASGTNITISVPGGNMVMEAGSEITSENTTGGGNGGNIAITVSGNFLMERTGVAAPASDLRCSDVEGACISTSDLEGGGGMAGNITITVGNFPNTPPVGIFTMEPGSAVLANSTTGSAGEIIATAGLSMDIDGLVRSFGGITGVSPQPRGGGPITLKSGCQLVITPDGVVSSEGRDPGADLVHLEGCEVVVNGLVQSIVTPGTSGGHALPTSPPNRCNNDTATHGTANKFTACVEIWANNITINSILPNKGEVDADGVTDNTTNDTRAWIDLFAPRTTSRSTTTTWGRSRCTPKPGTRKATSAG